MKSRALPCPTKPFMTGSSTPCFFYSRHLGLLDVPPNTQLQSSLGAFSFSVFDHPKHIPHLLICITSLMKSAFLCRCNMHVVIFSLSIPLGAVPQEQFHDQGTGSVLLTPIALSFKQCLYVA